MKLDPTNQVAWNNLVSARIQNAYYLLSLGQVGDGIEQARAALAVERLVKESGMIGTVLSLASGYLARFEANAGNRRASIAAIASNQRFVALAIRDLPDRFVRSCVPAGVRGLLRYPATGLGYGAYSTPTADGDFEAVREMARASAKRLEQLTELTPSQAQSRNAALEVAYRTIADASYRLKDYQGADADIQRALAFARCFHAQHRRGTRCRNANGTRGDDRSPCRAPCGCTTADRVRSRVAARAMHARTTRI